MFTLVPAGEDDVPFAHDLSRDNMAQQFAAAGIAWNPALIPESWPLTDNYLLLDGQTRIGILRVRVSPGEFYISDLQVLRGQRNRGAGSFALTFIVNRARQRGVTRLRLRVFTGSPALRLYQRAGFTLAGDEGAKQLLEKNLGPP